MPITILAPTQDQPFGPGFIVHAKTDFIGPLPDDTIWIASITDTTDQFQSTYGLAINNSSELNWVLGFDQRSGQVPISPVAWPFFQDATVRCLVQLSSQSTGFSETASVQVKLDNTTGIPYLQQALSHPETQGGFTDTDRQNLNAVQMAVIPQLPTFAGAVTSAVALASFIANPPEAWLCEDTSVTVTGDMVLTKPDPLYSVAAYGADVFSVDPPPELSKLPGWLPEWHNRLAQVTYVRKDGCGNEYTSPPIAIHLDRNRLVWGLPSPERILVSCLPGVTLTWTWLKWGFFPP